MRIRLPFLVLWFLSVYFIAGVFLSELPFRFGRLFQCAIALSSYSFAP
ncbi:hypothetical protein CCP3SC15_1720008 [Gammaproteobacteria bacterium]